MKYLAVSLMVLSTALIDAQTSQTTSPSSEAWSPAKSIGMYAYPKNQQFADQQLRDESDCYGSAKQQTGVDPQAAAPAAPNSEQQTPAQQEGGSVPKGGTVKGSARGAAGGAAIGAIAGDAGKGAAIGATGGAMAGRHRQKKAEKEAKQQATQQQAQAQEKTQAEAQSQHQASLDSFKRSFSACMDARGYSVK